MLHEEENEAIRLLRPIVMIVMIVMILVRMEIGKMMNQVRARGGNEGHETHDHPERLQTTA